MQLLNLFLFWVFFGCLASYFAKRRGRNPTTWFFIGLFLGILGVLLAAFLPKRVVIRKRRRVAPPPPQQSDAWLKMWYYLDSSHQQVGPLEFPVLIELRKQEQVSEKSLVWGEGMKEWKPLKELPDLTKEMDSHTASRPRLASRVK